MILHISHKYNSTDDVTSPSSSLVTDSIVASSPEILSALL